MGIKYIKGRNGKFKGSVSDGKDLPQALHLPSKAHLPSAPEDSSEANPAAMYSRTVNSSLPKLVSETANIVPIRTVDLPECVDVETFHDAEGREFDSLNEMTPPKTYVDNLNWSELYLVRKGFNLDDGWEDLTSAVIAENVKSKLSNPTYQGVDENDPTPYIHATKDIIVLAQLIRLTHPKATTFSEAEKEAANRILEGSFPKGTVISEKTLNPHIVSKDSSGFRFAPDADTLLAAGERFGKKKNVAKHIEQMKIEEKSPERAEDYREYKNEIYRGRFIYDPYGASRQLPDETWDMFRRPSFYDRQPKYSREYILETRFPSPSKELQEVRKSVVETRREINSYYKSKGIFDGIRRKARLNVKKKELLQRQAALEADPRSSIIKY